MELVATQVRCSAPLPTGVTQTPALPFFKEKRQPTHPDIGIIDQDISQTRIGSGALPSLHSIVEELRGKLGLGNKDRWTLVPSSTKAGIKEVSLCTCPQPSAPWGFFQV